jgi:hypothetical protein
LTAPPDAALLGQFRVGGAGQPGVFLDIEMQGFDLLET